MNPERHQKLMSIVADAMECDTAERALLLLKSCDGDAALRHDAERLLRLSKLASNFMEEPLFESAALRDQHREEPIVGKSVGPYLVTTEIGRGGMAAVYLAARNDDAYRRQVAIKIVKRGMDTDVILRRFRNERQILANLNHQNIARLFDGGTTDDGRPYLVMEYVEGRPIHRYANEHDLSIHQRLKLFLPVCEAVEYAHRHGVIHRDLKPGNILVTNEGIPKLLDFGIAKLLFSEGRAVTADTTITALQGMTPEYASPEQMRGETLTIATDIYSLGVLLYELLAGRRPFESEQGSPFEIVRKVCEEAPEKPSTLVTRKRSNGNATSSGPAESRVRMLAGDLDTIVLMALRKEPERRYTAVAEFAEDIRRYLEGHPINARKDATAYRAAKFLKRNRRYVLGTAMIALICVILGISLALLTAKGRLSSSDAAARQSRADRRSLHDDEAYQLYLQGTYFWNRRNEEGFQKAIEYYQRAIQRDPNYAPAYDGLAKTYALMGAYYMPFEEPFPKAKTAALKALVLDPNLAEAHATVGLINWLYDWEWATAEKEFKQATELDPNYVTAHHWYGLFLGEMGRADESITEMKRALELDPLSVAVHADLGRVYFWARRYDEALRQYERASEMEPTIGAFWTEMRYVYEQKRMYLQWFSMLDKPIDVNDYNRDAFLKQDWKEFVRVNCEHGSSHGGAEDCARAGDKDRAFHFFEDAIRDRDHRMSQLRVNPVWDPLRSDPRFIALLRRMNL